MRLFALGIALSLTACRTVRAREAPAVVVAPTEESRAALAQAVSTALNGAPVTLADDALTRTDVLVVERVRPRDASGLPLEGRDLGVPERFRLVKRADRCVLVHDRTGRELPLAATACAPL